MLAIELKNLEETARRRQVATNCSFFLRQFFFSLKKLLRDATYWHLYEFEMTFRKRLSRLNKLSRRRRRNSKRLKLNLIRLDDSKINLAIESEYHFLFVKAETDRMEFVIDFSERIFFTWWEYWNIFWLRSVCILNFKHKVRNRHPTEGTIIVEFLQFALSSFCTELCEKKYVQEIRLHDILYWNYATGWSWTKGEEETANWRKWEG